MSTLLLVDPAHPQCVLYERARVRARLSARLHAWYLDRSLAEGVSPDSSATLSLRARQLIGKAARAHLAGALRELIRDASRPAHPLDPGVPVCRRKVLASSDALLALADRLSSRQPVAAAGVAQVRLLLLDGAGPVYRSGPEDDLAGALERAFESLEP